LTGCYGLATLKNKNSVVILREPISRVRSTFVDKQFPSGTAEQKAKVKSLSSLADYVALPGISNCQTKVLIGKSCTDPAPVGSAEVGVAKLRLDAIDFFGLSEHYATSVCLMYKTFGGVPVDEDFQFVKKSTIYKPSVPLSPQDEQAARTSEETDLLIYQYAEQIFSQRLKAHNQPLID